jgi:hypothetical protein
LGEEKQNIVEYEQHDEDRAMYGDHLGLSSIKDSWNLAISDYQIRRLVNIH